MRALFLSVVLSVPLLLGAGSAYAELGRVLTFEGEVLVNGQQVTSDTVLRKDDKIVTGPDATAQFVLADNSVLDMESDSEININEYLFDPGEPANNTSQISVLAGTLRYVSGKIAKDDPENVSFTAGESTIGVRGTYISISVCPEGEECD